MKAIIAKQTTCRKDTDWHCSTAPFLTGIQVYFILQNSANPLHSVHTNTRKLVLHTQYKPGRECLVLILLLLIQLFLKIPQLGKLAVCRCACQGRSNKARVEIY